MQSHEARLANPSGIAKGCSMAGAALSPNMALRIEKAFGPKMDTLLRMQTAYEIAEARDREGEIKVRRYVPKPAVAHEPASLPR